MNLRAKKLLMAVIGIVLIACAFRFAAAGETAPDGAALYRLRCSACHPDASQLKSTKDIIYAMRNPPPPMPAFSEDKVSKNDAQAIAGFIHPLAQPVMSSVSFDIASDPPLEPVKLTWHKTGRIRSFIRDWSIKGMRDGKPFILQQFTITADAENILIVRPITRLSENAVKLTQLELVDETLKLQFKWKMKNARTYWKIETYELTLSDDGRTLSGSYSLHAPGKSSTLIVWGE